MSLRAVQYLRVSRTDQDPRLQDDETKEFITRRGWDLADTYTDHGVSGARDRRPELDRLLGDGRRRRFDVLVVWRSDRMFRSIKNMVVTLDELGALGIAFASVKESFDMTCPSGRLLMHVVSAMAEFERCILQERVCAGVAAARRRGVRVGRPPARLDVDHLRELRQQGWSVRRIADELHVGPSTVQRHLAKEQVVVGG